MYFQLLNKEKDIINTKNDNEFWDKVKKYFSEKGKIGILLEQQFKELDFSNENMLSLNNLCEGKTNKLTLVYYSKLCPTTGLFVFVVKDALEYIGILEDKKVLLEKFIGN